MGDDADDMPNVPMVPVPPPTTTEPTATPPEAVVAPVAPEAVVAPVALPAPIIRWCYCNMDSTEYDENDEDGDDMVECTNLNCALKWFHIPHIPMIDPEDWEPPEDWMCLACSRNA